jgi:hypothetical protein
LLLSTETRLVVEYRDRRIVAIFASCELQPFPEKIGNACFACGRRFTNRTYTCVFVCVCLCVCVCDRFEFSESINIK